MGLNPDDVNPRFSASVRHALQADGPALLHMVGDLARHHGDVPRVDEEVLDRDLFGTDPWATALIQRERVPRHTSRHASLGFVSVELGYR